MRHFTRTLTGILILLSVTANAAVMRDEEALLRKRNENLERAFQQYYEKTQAEYGDQLKELAEWAAGKGLAEETAAVLQEARSLDPKIEPDAVKIAPDATPTEEDKEAFAENKEKLAEDFADTLFSLGGKCFRAGLVGRAYDMVWEVVRYNPNHEDARKLLGQVYYNDQWMDRYDAIQLHKGKIFTEDYGWIYKRYLDKYEEGYLPIRGRWAKKEAVEEIRKEWANAWRYETEHFVIETNVSLKDAVIFGEIVEDNYDIFYRVFISYFSPKNQSKMLFGLQEGQDKMKVNYFATQEEFRQYVHNIDAAGVYMPDRRTSNFFKTNWNFNLRVLKHETTHQMFVESRRRAGYSEHGAWLVEGAATYMETCYRKDGRIVTDGRNDARVRQFAQLLQSGKAIPLKVFDDFSYEQFSANGSNAYAQASTLAHFFMEAEDCKYRERFVEYIKAFYNRRLKIGGAMAECIGEPIEDIEREVIKYAMGDLTDEQADEIIKQINENWNSTKK